MPSLPSTFTRSHSVSTTSYSRLSPCKSGSRLVHLTCASCHRITATPGNLHSAILHPWRHSSRGQLQRNVAERCQPQASQTRCRALPGALATLAEATLARDIAATLVSIIGGAILVKIFNSLQQSGALSRNVSRKLVHILAAPGSLLCWPLFSSAPYARYFAALVPALNMLGLLLIGTGVVRDQGTVMSMSRQGNKRELLRGPLYYTMVLMAATMLFWRESPIGLTAVALMSGGDGLADLVGRRYGTAKLPHNPQKSWAGSLAMFLGGWGMAVGFIALYQRLGMFECTLPAIAASVGIMSFATAVFESLPINHWLDDNLSVPLLAVLLGQYLFASSVVVLA